jgi:hypothetical protein
MFERKDGARSRRGPQTRAGDVELATDIRRFVDARPTYGYRRIAALLKRERRSAGEAAVNSKRVYRLMKKHGLLLARHTGRRRPRRHDGQVATIRSNVRWCSDVLEFTCWNGEIVRVAFALDCHDREVIGWTVTTRSLGSSSGWRITTQCTRTRGWATVHRGSISAPSLNPPRVRSNGVNSSYTAVFPVSNDVDNDICIMLRSSVYHNERF